MMTGSNFPWVKKISDDPWSTKQRNLPSNSIWKPARFSGKFKFRKSKFRTSATFSSAFVDPIQIELQYPSYGNQFSEYCQATSLHGFRYITEKKRSLCERIFWICCCVFGISGAAYLMSKIWQRWASNPVITSVATTNLAVSNILFPAVTICTVNKAVNEKLIIQGCRYNKTFSQMRAIISTIVDSKSENNDNVLTAKNEVDPTIALRYLRLVAPKCDDYLLRCSWNSKLEKPCSKLFKMVLTDTGYCCTFNAIHSKSTRKEDRVTNKEVQEQEAEYEILQQAVWNYVDEHRIDISQENTNINTNNTMIPEDINTCKRVYGDELFPGICKHLNKCRKNPHACQIGPTRNTSTAAPAFEIPESSSSTDGNGNSGEDHVQQQDEFRRAAGAGRSRGLTLMTDTLRCDTVPTDSFKGLRVYVHGVDEFPAVGERGFLVGPGMETQVGVTAVDTYSVESLRVFQPENRGCYFADEFPLRFHKNYSRSACVVECETEFIQDRCECVPYYNPGNYTICKMQKMIDCVSKYIDEIQKRLSDNKRPKPSGEKVMFNFKTKEDREQNKGCTEHCLPACNETFYNIVVTAADFPNQPQPNMTKSLREAIKDGYSFLNEISYVTGSISLLRVYFREPSIMQYKRDELFTWEDFVSNLGGVMGLCLGFSLLSLIEVVYFFTLRICIERKRYWKEHEKNEMILTPGISHISV